MEVLLEAIGAPIITAVLAVAIVVAVVEAVVTAIIAPVVVAIMVAVVVAEVNRVVVAKYSVSMMAYPTNIMSCGEDYKTISLLLSMIAN